MNFFIPFFKREKLISNVERDKMSIVLIRLNANKYLPYFQSSNVFFKESTYIYNIILYNILIILISIIKCKSIKLYSRAPTKRMQNHAFGFEMGTFEDFF